MIYSALNEANKVSLVDNTLQEISLLRDGYKSCSCSFEHFALEAPTVPDNQSNPYVNAR